MSGGGRGRLSSDGDNKECNKKEVKYHLQVGHRCSRAGWAPGFLLSCRWQLLTSRLPHLRRAPEAVPSRRSREQGEQRCCRLSSEGLMGLKARTSGPPAFPRRLSDSLRCVLFCCVCCGCFFKWKLVGFSSFSCGVNFGDFHFYKKRIRLICSG